MSFGNPLNAISDFVSDIFGSVSGRNQQIDFEKKMQYLAWKRDDTAVQRRVADLKAAGLSPVLAAGAGASNTPPIRSDARMENISKGMQNFLMAKEFQQRQLNLMKTKADTELSNVRKEVAEKEKFNATLRSLQIGEDTVSKQLQNAYKRMEIDYYNNFKGLPPGQKLSGVPLYGAILGSAYYQLKNENEPKKISKEKQELQNLIDEYKRWEEQDKLWKQ